jgi:hypothetical protein
MRALITAILVCTAIVQVSGQAESAKYERGTIVAVARHQTDQGDSDQVVAKYDVSIQVRDTVFVVLYTPPNGANGVEYAPGIDLLVLIGQDTLTFPSKLSGTTEVPILQRKDLPAQDVLDWSKAPSQYFAMKMRHLSASLGLSDDQQARIKPIAEQEAGEAGQVCFNPVVPRKERLKQWEKIVRASDAKIKPILSEDQWDRLQEIREQQKRDLQDLIANKDAGS